MVTLLKRAWCAAVKDHCEQELEHLCNVFRKNGYSLSEVSRIFTLFDCKTQGARNDGDEEPIRAVAVPPFYQTITNRLTRLLQHKQIRTTSYPHLKLKQHLCPVKDPVALNVPAVYQVPCNCGASYVGQKGRLVSTRIKEHSRHVRVGQTDKSVIAYHCWSKDHQASFLYHSENWQTRFLRESLEIALMSWRRGHTLVHVVATM